MVGLQLAMLRQMASDSQQLYQPTQVRYYVAPRKSPSRDLKLPSRSPSRSYSCFTSESMSDHRCQTFLSSGQTLTNIWVATPTPSVVLSIPSNLSLTTYVVPAGTSAVCDAIPVLWQNTDIQVLALLGQTTLGNSTVSITSASLSTVQSPTSTGSLTSNLPSSSHNAGLSAGAKAAIGVAIPIFFIFTVLAIFTFFRRRGRKIHRTHAELADTSSHWTKIEFFGKRGEKKVGGELDSRARYEADPQSAILEMGPGRRSAEVHEMGDTSRIQEKYGEERGRTSERKRIGVEGRTWFEEGRGDEDEEVEREVDLVSALSPPPHYSTR